MIQKIRLVIPEAPSPQAVAVTEARAVAKGGIRLGILDNSKGQCRPSAALHRRRRQGAAAGRPRSWPCARTVSACRLPLPFLINSLAESDYVLSAMGD